MPYQQNTQQYSEFEYLFRDKYGLADQLSSSLSRFMVSKQVRMLKELKTKGHELPKLFATLLLMPLLGCLSVYAMYRPSVRIYAEAGKDAYYDLLNHPNIDWRRLLYAFVKTFIAVVDEHGTSHVGKPTAFIIDDTVIEKTGKKIEGTSMVYDHTDGSYKLGFKLLSLAFFDGCSTTGVDYSLHNEQNEKRKKAKAKATEQQYKQPKQTPRDQPRQCCDARIQELTSKKTDTALELLRRAVKNGLKASYILIDSWFMSSDLLKTARELAGGTMHVVGMVKKDNRNYEIDGQVIKAKQLIEVNKRHEHKNRKYKFCYFTSKLEYKGLAIKLVFIRMGQQENYKILLTTNLKLTAQEVFELYQIRWSIEVMFRDCKQNLALGECQSNCFNAHIATITLAFMRHVALSLTLRFTKYETIGSLFRATQDAITEQHLYNRILLFIKDVVIEFAHLVQADWEMAMQQFMLNTDKIKQLLKIYDHDNKSHYGAISATA